MKTPVTMGRYSVLPLSGVIICCTIYDNYNLLGPWWNFFMS